VTVALIYLKNYLNELEEQGFIKAFKFSYELAWNLMKAKINEIISADCKSLAQSL